MADAMLEGDKRGIIPPAQAEQVRRLRAAEQWERYDSIVIGPGAGARAAGWFDTWAEFAAADQLEWFGGREANIGRSFANQTTERLDFAQDIYQTNIEFITPPGLGANQQAANDASIVPILFTQDLPTKLVISTVLADADEISVAPANHYPSAFGVTNTVMSSMAAPSMLAGTQGDAHISNAWKWPEPVMLAAKSRIVMRGRIDQPIRNLFASLPGPGNLIVPIGETNYVYPNWYIIKITMRGPRYVQLRGARSA